VLWSQNLKGRLLAVAGRCVGSWRVCAGVLEALWAALELKAAVMDSGACSYTCMFGERLDSPNVPVHMVSDCAGECFVSK